MAGHTTSRHTRDIARNASTVAGATLVSRALGLCREIIIASALGTGPHADAFFVAFRLPNLMRKLFGEGSLTMAFVPVFSRLRAERGLDEAAALTRSCLAWLIILVGGICLLVLVLARPLTMLYAAGLQSDPALFDLTVTLVRICFPYALFICAVALCMGALNAMDRFLAPALASAVLNCTLIAAGLLALFLDWDAAIALSAAVLVGGGMQWLSQQPFLRDAGLFWKGPWSLRHPGVVSVARLMLPSLFGVGAYQMTMFLGTHIATFLPSGSVSYLYYADRLVQFPLGVFGVAVGTAALPSLSKLAALGPSGAKDFTATLNSSLRLTLYICLPATAGLIALSEPLIALLYGRGAFTPQAVRATALALDAFALGLPAFALARPLASAYYARQDSRTPPRIAFLHLCFYCWVAPTLALVPNLEHLGLALATTLSSWVDVLLLCLFLGPQLKPWNRWQGFVRAGARHALLSLALGLMVWTGWRLTPPGMKLASLGLIPLWAGLYLACGHWLKLEEAELFWSMVRGRGRKKSAPATQDEPTS